MNLGVRVHCESPCPIKLLHINLYTRQAAPKAPPPITAVVCLRYTLLDRGGAKPAGHRPTWRKTCWPALSYDPSQAFSRGSASHLRGTFPHSTRGSYVSPPPTAPQCAPQCARSDACGTSPFWHRRAFGRPSTWTAPAATCPDADGMRELATNLVPKSISGLRWGGRAVGESAPTLSEVGRVAVPTTTGNCEESDDEGQMPQHATLSGHNPVAEGRRLRCTQAMVCVLTGRTRSKCAVSLTGGCHRARAQSTVRLPRQHTAELASYHTEP